MKNNNESLQGDTKKSRSLLNKIVTGFVSTVVLSTAPAVGQEATEVEEVFELSPFVVTEDEDIGYLATSTLAGSRLKTNLSDVGSAISVLTKEFIEDLGSTSAETLLQNAVNMETAGFQGNYAADGDEASGQNRQRINPHNTQRVRGLGSATLTRDYFMTNIPFDTYNTDRITINRGPNSLLFGIGTPGGVIDNSLSKANTSKNMTELSFRLGERESTRLTLDVNRVLIEDRLAFRFALLGENTNYQQEPAFEKDERFYGAVEAVLRKGGSGFLGRSTIRANFEGGEITSNRPNVVPPLSELQHWFEAPDPSLDGKWAIKIDPGFYDGTWQPKSTLDDSERFQYGFMSAPGAQAIPFWVQMALVTADPTSGAFGGAFGDGTVEAMQGGWGWGPGGGPTLHFVSSGYITDQFAEGPASAFYKIPTIGYNIFDNQNLLLSGNSNKVTQDFKAANITFEQFLLDGNAGINLTYNRQNYDTYSVLPYAGNGGGHRNTLRIDMNEFWPSGDPNPNVGRVFLETDEISSRHLWETDNEAIRLTAFYELDLSEREGFWGNLLGRHVFTGMMNEQTLESYGENTRFVWGDHEEVDMTGTLGNPRGGWRRNINNVMYLSESLLDDQYQTVDDVRLTQTINVGPIEDGDTFKVKYYDKLGDQDGKIATFTANEILAGGSISKQTITSKVASWQSYLFDGHIVGLLGWRDDESSKWERVPESEDLDYTLPDLTMDPTTIVLAEDPSLVLSGETITKSLVGHLPDGWNPVSDHVSISAHWSESENFQPTSARRNIWGESIAPPTGTTEEYGFTLSLNDRKLMVRLNWYETAAVGRSVNTQAGIFRYVFAEGNRWNEARRLGIPFRSIGNPGEEGYQQGAYDWAIGAYTGDNASADNPIDSDYQTYDEFFTALINATPEPTRSLLNIRIEEDQTVSNPILGQTATSDAISEGFEVDIVGQITPYWSLSLNIGKQETINSNTALEYQNFIDQVIPNLKEAGLYWLGNAPNLGIEEGVEKSASDSYTIGTEYVMNAVAPVAAARSKDGTLSSEQRKWRVNLATSYRFKPDSYFDGFSVGAVLRYQSKVAIGYEQLDEDGDGVFLPKLDDPIYGPSDTRGDLWVRYTRKLGEKITWKVQLNVRNALGDLEPIPFLANPDRTFARFRNPPTREFFITNTISF